MTDQANQPLLFVGCDVGKEEIVVCDSRTGRLLTLANKAKALATWAATLPAGCLVVCEATGGYEAALLAALCAAGVAVHRADARKVKAFIRSFGILGKTDALDARALARYAAERHAQLARWRAPEETRRKLHALVSARRDLVAERTACANRLKAPGAEVCAPYFSALAECLETQIRALDADIAALIASDGKLAQTVEIVQSVPGIGAPTAAALVALMPELGALSGKKVAALAGLAPHPKQSGKMDAYRHVRGGRPEIKRVLFMAALSAATRAKAFKDFYQRLIQNGKKPLVAVIAVMRKMLVIANARLRDAKLYQEHAI